MDIRPYREADLDAVARLFTESVHRLASAQYDAAQCAAWAPRTPDLEHWRARLRGRVVFVAEEQRGLAGFLAYEPDGHIDMLFTSPDHPRRGVASALYRRAEADLASRGVVELFTEASLVARPFFERHGFRVVEEQTVALRGASFRRFAMRKP